MIIPPELDGERVDKVVAVLAGVSRAVGRQMVDLGTVTVGGVPVDARTRVAAGSEVEFPAVPGVLGIEAEEVAFQVAYEDADLVVIDKPAGLVVHPGGGRRTGTLVSGLIHRFPEIEGVGVNGRWGIVHRLDRDTSGLMVVARTDEAYQRLKAQVSAHALDRVYVTLVLGLFPIPTGAIDAPIGTDPSDPRKRKVVAGGRSAFTRYRLLREFPDVEASLLEVELETGRTHQIRVHLAAIGHPVIGDPWYGRPCRVASPRVFLHASRLAFDHPLAGGRVECESQLPTELQAVLDSLGE